MPSLRIAYCTWEDPNDRRSFSGVHYYASRALARHCGEVIYLGPIPSWSMRMGRVYDKLAGKLLHRHYDFLHSRAVARGFARRIEARLRELEVDVLFAPVVSETIAFLRTEVPIVYLADATFALLEDAYPTFTNLLRHSRRQGHDIERRAIENATKVIYASEWAAESGRRDYGCPPEKIHVELLGCNLDDPPTREVALGRKITDACRLLFVSREWERKGGAQALGILRELRGLGVDARLKVIGCTPQDGESDPHMEIIAYLDKNDPRDAARYAQAFAEATFLVAPTRRDCSPMIFGEAAAHGLPVIATAVGGVSSIVRDEKNGFTLPLEASPIDYARLLREIFEDPPRYRQLVQRSRSRFENELNWDRWAIHVGRVLRSVVGEGSAERPRRVPG